MLFLSDPDLKWTRKNCEYCLGPTGPNSGCENLQTKGVPPNNTFSLSCPNKNGYGWIIDFNYPASMRVVEAIKSIHGIDTIFPVSPYRVEIRIATLANESEVKKEVARVYKNLIKSVQVLVDKPIPTEAKITIDDTVVTIKITPDGCVNTMAAIEALSNTMPEVVSHVYTYSKN